MNPQNRETALTRAYIDDHIPEAHTPESFGRAIMAQALEAAKSLVPERGAESVSLDATIKVAPRLTTDPAGRPVRCVSICVVVGNVQICGSVHSL
jgi:hypothetical protein